MQEQTDSIIPASVRKKVDNSGRGRATTCAIQACFVFATSCCVAALDHTSIPQPPAKNYNISMSYTLQNLKDPYQP